MLRHSTSSQYGEIATPLPTSFETQLQFAIAARQANALAQAMAIMEQLLQTNANDEGLLTESLLLACQTNDHQFAIRALRQAASIRGTPLDAAMALAATSLFNRLYAPVAVNIGGGPGFMAPLWKNIEGVRSPANPHPIELSPTTIVPIDSASVEIVYTSHCLEHLDDATVLHMLKEARRILHPQGYLVIKIPDFEQILHGWTTGDDTLLADNHWNFQSVAPYLRHRGLDLTREYRTAMIFCGFWNAAHGNPFAGAAPLDPSAYHGPPTPPPEFLQSLFQGQSPHTIAQKLVEWVKANEPSYTFNHQNAWSREELSHLLQSCNFECLSFDHEHIIRRFHEIPGLADMANISLYCVATIGAIP